eukprot:TRINITY_DN13583_c0_g1_i1.p1 TRINITY_DN13583_c0_g1~~TRINITY_DN13583_c0_g1_i1.p1  ORF type:complete len:287 (+),score=50.50 TRINITY_DN13583_c0_g1_i1:72-932(+)
MDNDGFTIVSYSKNKNKRHKKNFRSRTNNNSSSSSSSNKVFHVDNDSLSFSPEEIQQLNNKISIFQNKIFVSPFYKTVSDLIIVQWNEFKDNISLKSNDNDNNGELNNLDDKANEEPVGIQIICYGLGSLAKSKKATYQFAFLLLIRELLEIPNVYLYDPILTKKEIDLIESYEGFNYIKINEECNRICKNLTCIYMPHCEKFMYNNLIKTNMESNSLNNLFIIGNRLSLYDEMTIQQKKRQLIKELLDSIPMMRETVFTAVYNDLPNCFNDLAITYYPTQSIIQT